MVYFWCHVLYWYENWICISACWSVGPEKRSCFLNQAECIFIVVSCARGKSWKILNVAPSPIKLPFLVFQNSTLNFGPFKITLSIPSHRLIFFCTSDEMAIDVREMEWMAVRWHSFASRFYDEIKEEHFNLYYPQEGKSHSKKKPGEEIRLEP